MVWYQVTTRRRCHFRSTIWFYVGFQSFRYHLRLLVVMASFVFYFRIYIENQYFNLLKEMQQYLSHYTIYYIKHYKEYLSIQSI